MSELNMRAVHWYDIQSHRVACGAPGQTNSTKYARNVTCTACLGVVLKGKGAHDEEESHLTLLHSS
jgi:hypothetical protein